MGFVLKFNDDFVTKTPDATIVATAPKATVSYEFNVDAELKTDEGKELQGLFTAEFKKKMDSWRKEQQAKFDDAIKWTVDNFKKKKAAAEKAKEIDKFTKEMEDFTGTTNKLLEQGVKAMLSQVDGVADAMVKKAIEAVNKKLKRKIILKKVAAVAKIVVFTGIIIAVAALSIAATVATGGAAAPLIIGALGTSIVAAKKIVDTAVKAWPSREKSMKLLAEKIEAYAKAYAYEMKKQEDETLRTLGPKERIKRALNSVGGARKDVIVALKDFMTWANNVKMAIELMGQKADGLSEDVMKLGKAGEQLTKSKEYQAMTLAEKKMTVALKRLREENKGLDEVINEAKAAIAAEVPDQGKLTGIVGKLKSFANSKLVQDVSEGVTLLSGGVTPLKKLVG